MASREAAERKARRREDAAGEETPRRRRGRRSILVDGLGDPGSELAALVQMGRHGLAHRSGVKCSSFVVPFSGHLRRQTSNGHVHGRSDRHQSLNTIPKKSFILNIFNRNLDEFDILHAN